MKSDRPWLIYEGMQDYLQYVRDRVFDRESFSIDPALPLIHEMAARPEHLNLFLPLTFQPFPNRSYMISHQANTVVFTMKMGVGFRYSKKQLMELGLCALLHDVGMFTIEDGILNKTGPLTDQEFNLIRDHSKVGRQIMVPFMDTYPFLPETVYQHHERENGQGYPRGLSGKSILEYAKIVGIIDCYEAMCNQRPNRKALLQFFSAKELLAQSKQALFPDNIIKTFLSEITLYPVGSRIRLNSGVACEVIATYSESPLKPDVRVILDVRGNPVQDEKIIRLRENPHFYIIDMMERDAAGSEDAEQPV